MRYDGIMKKIRNKIEQKTRQQTLLGGISTREFLEQYWQKKPLLIRGAMPDFKGLLSAEELAGLACEEDAQSRLVSYVCGKWQLEQGPFDEARFHALPKKSWSLLVQGVNHHLPEAAALLQQFDFIPHARLDDLMVSYAPDGGGAGPHVDSYDVFLLQGLGKRLWRISGQKDLTLVEDAPLRILKNFETEQEWLLQPGDMLYLPPQIAHWGIAVGDCMTYSIGFRAPSAQELTSQFMDYLQKRINIEGMYADPGLKSTHHPAEISRPMVSQVSKMLSRIKWRREDVARFLGSYLSEPKPHVIFEKPNAISLTAFRARLAKRGISLSLKSLTLFHGDQIFMNGECLEVSDIKPAERHLLLQLADQRGLPVTSFKDEQLVEQLHQWYLAGYIEFSH